MKKIIVMCMALMAMAALMLGPPAMASDSSQTLKVQVLQLNAQKSTVPIVNWTVTIALNDYTTPKMSGAIMAAPEVLQPGDTGYYSYSFKKFCAAYDYIGMAALEVLQPKFGYISAYSVATWVSKHPTIGLDDALALLTKHQFLAAHVIGPKYIAIADTHRYGALATTYKYYVNKMKQFVLTGSGHFLEIRPTLVLHQHQIATDSKLMVETFNGKIFYGHIRGGPSIYSLKDVGGILAKEYGVHHIPWPHTIV